MPRDQARFYILVRQYSFITDKQGRKFCGHISYGQNELNHVSFTILFVTFRTRSYEMESNKILTKWDIYTYIYVELAFRRKDGF